MGTRVGSSVAVGSGIGVSVGVGVGGWVGSAGATVGSSVAVGTGSLAVDLGEVQPPGKRPMPAADWARGARIVDGERFG